jgi:hypothetical protein
MMKERKGIVLITSSIVVRTVGRNQKELATTAESTDTSSGTAKTRRKSQLEQQARRRKNLVNVSIVVRLDTSRRIANPRRRLKVEMMKKLSRLTSLAL